RFSRDWSSDVCSSDLVDLTGSLAAMLTSTRLNLGSDIAIALEYGVYSISGSVAEGSPIIAGCISWITSTFLETRRPLAQVIRSRSEERRVGNECRCRR